MLFLNVASAGGMILTILQTSSLQSAIGNDTLPYLSPFTLSHVITPSPSAHLYMLPICLPHLHVPTCVPMCSPSSPSTHFHLKVPYPVPTYSSSWPTTHSHLLIHTHDLHTPFHQGSFPYPSNVISLAHLIIFITKCPPPSLIPTTCPFTPPPYIDTSLSLYFFTQTA